MLETISAKKEQLLKELQALEELEAFCKEEIERDAERRAKFLAIGGESMLAEYESFMASLYSPKNDVASNCAEAHPSTLEFIVTDEEGKIDPLIYDKIYGTAIAIADTPQFKEGDRVTLEEDPEFRGTVISFKENIALVAADNKNLVRFDFSYPGTGKLILLESEPEPPTEQEVVDEVVDRVIEESNGLTQPQLAERLGRAPNTLSTAKNKPPADFAEYTKNLDPEGIAWRWDAKESKYYRFEQPKEEKPVVANAGDSFEPGDVIQDYSGEFFAVIYDRQDVIDCLPLIKGKHPQSVLKAHSEVCSKIHGFFSHYTTEEWEKQIVEKAIALSKEYEAPSDTEKSSTDELKPGDIVDFDDENLAAVISDGDGVELLPFVSNPNPIVVPFWRVGHRPDVVPTEQQQRIIERAIALSKGKVEPV